MKTEGVVDADEDEKLNTQSKQDRAQHDVAGIVKLAKNIHHYHQQKNRYHVTLEDPLEKLGATTHGLEGVFQTPYPAADPDQSKGDQAAPILSDDDTGSIAQLRYRQK